MKRLIAILLVALSVGCANEMNLPMKVTGKYESSSGPCYLVIKPNTGMYNSDSYFETGWHEAYCQYEAGQEIK